MYSVRLGVLDSRRELRRVLAAELLRIGQSLSIAWPNSCEFAEFVYRVAVAKGLLDSTQAVTSSASLGSLKGLNQLLPCKFSRHRTSHRRRLDRSSQSKCSNTE